MQQFQDLCKGDVCGKRPGNVEGSGSRIRCFFDSVVKVAINFTIFLHRLIDEEFNYFYPKIVVVNASLHWLNNVSCLIFSFPLITSGV